MLVLLTCTPAIGPVRGRTVDRSSSAAIVTPPVCPCVPLARCRVLCNTYTTNGRCLIPALYTSISSCSVLSLPPRVTNPYFPALVYPSFSFSAQRSVSQILAGFAPRFWAGAHMMRPIRFHSRQITCWQSRLRALSHHGETKGLRPIILSSLI